MRACLCQKLDTSDWQSNGPKRLVRKPTPFVLLFKHTTRTSYISDTSKPRCIRKDILSSNLEDVRINQEGVEGGTKKTRSLALLARAASLCVVFHKENASTAVPD